MSLLLLLLLAAGGFLFLNRIGVPRFLKDRLETELRGQGINLQLDRVRLRGFRVFAAENIRLGNQADTNGVHLFIRDAELRLKPDALRRFQIQLEAVSLEHARLSCVLTASNAPPAQASLDELSVEIRFPALDQWELADLRGRLLNASLQVSGTITNPAAISGWLTPRTPRKAEVNWMDRLHGVITQWQKLGLTAPSSLTLQIHGDGRDPNSFQAHLKSQVAQADTPWGRIDKMQLDATLSPSVQAKARTEAKLRLLLEAARTEWGNLEQGQVQADLRWSWSDPAAFLAEWRWSSPRARTRWAEADNVAVSGTTRLATDGPATLHTEFSLDATSLRNAWGKSSTNHLTATLAHSRTNLTSWDATWRLATQQLESRWGRSENALLTGHASRSAPAASERKAGTSWGPWTKLEPIQFDWEVQLHQLQSPQIKAGQLDFAGQWRAPKVAISKLRLDLSGGRIDSSARLDVATRELTTETRLSFDLRQIPSFPMTNVQRWLQQFTWEVPPRLTMQGRMMLPAWTNSSPNWREEILPNLQLSGFLECTNGAIRSLPITSLQSHFALTNLLWRAPDLLVTSPRGSVRLDYQGNLQTQDFQSGVQSQLDLMALKPLLATLPPRVFDLFAFSEPPLIRGTVWGCWRQPDRIGFSAQVAATNFIFRGEKCSDFRSTVQFTNRFLHLTDVKIRRDDRQITASDVGYDLRSEFVYVTNGLSTMDPDLVTKVIGPKVRAAIKPYRFEQPPVVRVNGRLPTRSKDPADARFQVQGQSFRYWRFNLPEVSGDLHWRGDSLSISNVQGRFYNGQLAWSGSFDFSPPKGTDFSFQGRATQADLRLLMADLSTLTNNLEGTLDGRLTIAAANSTDARTWQGFGDVQLRDGFLSDIPVFGFLSPLLNKIAPGVGHSRASAASATYSVKDGAVHTSDLEVHSPALRLQYDGKVDFQGQVDARVQAEILRDTWAVGRLVSLALWPLTKVFEYKITGTLRQPQSHPLYLPKFLLWPFKPLQGLRHILPAEDPKPPASPEPPNR